MAASGYTPIILFNSTTTGNTPTTSNLAVGELAINVTDGKLFFNQSGTIKVLANATYATSVSTISFGTTGLTPSTATNGVVTVAGTLAVANGGTGVTTSTGSGSVVLSTSPSLVTPILGTPTSVTLTNATGLPLTTGVAGTLATTNGGTGLTSFTSGGVVYASSTSALATGSGLVFDGSNLGLGVTPYAWYSGSSAKVFQNNNGSFYADSANSISLASNWGFTSAGAQQYISNGFATRYIQSSGQHIWNTAASGTAGNAITFTQAMTLDASGNLAIGNTAPNYKLHVTSTFGIGPAGLIQQQLSFTNQAIQSLVLGSGYTDLQLQPSGGNLLVGTTTAIDVTSGTTDGQTLYNGGRTDISRSASPVVNLRRRTSDGSIVQFFRDTTNVGNISVTTSATSYNTSSDYRLKNTIAPMTGALAKVAQLKPVTYKWNVDGSDGEGFIAHELAEVCPNAVNGEKDAVDADGKPQYQGIDTSFLVATLTAAIQEQQALITQLTTRLTALENK